MLEEKKTMMSLTREINLEIRKKRNSEKVDLDLIRNLIEMFSDLEIYYSVFEREYKRETEEFYRKEALLRFADSSPSEYLDHVNSRLEFEKENCRQLFVSEGIVTAILKKEFIHEKAQELVQKYFNHFADQKQFNEIGKLYNLLENNNVPFLKQEIAKYIESNGVDIIQCENSEMMDRLLEFQATIKSVVKVGLADNVEFQQLTKESFESFLNKKQNKPAELIALYFDKLLKKTKGSTEEEIELKLDECLSLFRLVQGMNYFILGKDIFEAFYGKSLAKRLLLEKSASVDAEKRVLVMLRSGNLGLIQNVVLGLQQSWKECLKIWNYQKISW
jgi:cullin-4